MSGSTQKEPQDMGVMEPARLMIEGLAAGGRGVARRDGLVWFVAGGLPGDLLDAEPLRRRPRAVEARAIRLVTASPQRRPVPCPLQERCGGCPWMPLDEALQRGWKRDLVAQALARLAGLDDPPVEPIRPSPRALGYRNRVELTLGRAGPGGAPAVGFHSQAAPGAGLVDVASCAILDPGADRVVATAREFLLPRAPVWLAAQGDGPPFRLLVRRSAWTGAVLVALVEPGREFPLVAELAGHLAAGHPELGGVVRLVARPGRRGGMRAVPVWGSPELAERLGGTEFRLGAESFLQVNLDVAAELVDLVVECAGDVGGRDVVELYGGAGALGLALARRGARVSICDADARAVACGRAATGTLVAHFTCGDALAFARRRAAQGPAAAVLANPPRSGLGRGVAAAIAGLTPRRVVLVSCDPATLARDVRALAQLGFTLERAVPLDMFPQTAHVETVAALVGAAR